MPQPPTLPVIAKELVRICPSLSQNTVRDAAAGAGEVFVWEWDLALRLTDTGQFIGALPAPANSTTIAGGGAGPQATPQPAFGPFLDVIAFCTGAGGASITVEISVDASPFSYRTQAITIVPQNVLTNIAQLRITGRFVRITLTNVTAAAVVEFGSYIRNL